MRAFELFLPDSNDFDSYNQYLRLCRKFRVKIMINRKDVKYIYSPYTYREEWIIVHIDNKYELVRLKD